MNRTEMIAAMDDPGERWDVIIIGGGSTGLGAAVEAASRGHRTVLVEAADFASGTSSRSTKLIHGGVRYLRQGRIGMVRQSLRERGRLFRNAPHIVRPLKLVLPAYHAGEQLWYYAGLKVYDLLAGKHRCGRVRQLSRKEVGLQLPNLREEFLRGGVTYVDGQFDDARLAITLASTAADLGAVVVNYAPVTRLLTEHGKLRGVQIQDLETNRELTLRGRVVINATGVFADRILRMDRESSTVADKPIASNIMPSQGSHLVVDASFLPGTSALMIPKTDDGRVLFAIPWQGKVVLGTTDICVKEVPIEPRPMASEVAYLLEHTERYLKRAPRESDIRSRFAGLRPLVGVRSGSQSTASLSREHEIRVSNSGLITVLGGKWTTYRQMSEDLVDRAETIGELPRVESQTAELRLHGFPTEDDSGSDAAEFANYGSNAASLRELIRNRPDLAQGLSSSFPTVAAEIVWSVRYEMARTLEDVLARRTRALFLDARAAAACAPAVADLLQRELQQTDAWKDEQIRQFSMLAQQYSMTAT